GTPMDNAVQPKCGLLPPAVRALALGVLVETVVPLLNNQGGAGGAVPPGQGAGDADAEARLWEALRCKCGELSALVLRADDPGEAITFVLGYLPKHFQYAFELCGRKHPPALAHFEAGRNGREGT